MTHATKTRRDERAYEMRSLSRGKYDAVVRDRCREQDGGRAKKHRQHSRGIYLAYQEEKRRRGISKDERQREYR